MPNLGSKDWAAAKVWFIRPCKSFGQVMLRQVASKIDGTDATVTSPSSPKGPKPLNLRDFFSEGLVVDINFE